MYFPFDISKATDAVAQFLFREGGQINIMKVVKLVYLLDRLSIKRRGIPVVGGAYFSLPNGPITSELLDLINSGQSPEDADSRWDMLVSDRQNHQISLMGDPPSSYLSQSELKLVDEIYKDHGNKDQWQLRDWTHEHCAEWTKLSKGRKEIPIESIAAQVGKSDSEIESIAQSANEALFINETIG